MSSAGIWKKNLFLVEFNFKLKMLHNSVFLLEKDTRIFMCSY